MKQLFLSFLIIFLISCKQKKAEIVGNQFYFSSPQPVNDSELNKFPNKFIGLYVDSDSLFFTITKEAMYYEANFAYRISISDLDSLKADFDFVNDKYVFKNSKEEFNYKSIGDSLELYSKQRDTFFI
ncbi:hypothetical protein [Flavobacterium sp. UBA6135]|uniref:hypothetical protein n=1 Tax=Flavobacterium sp. UBA6135 TaxID=1946553 RepID=UPI0025C4AEE6|nr:hypothetical protein [Flavobacterium sp. UBA6135]